MWRFYTKLVVTFSLCVLSQARMLICKNSKTLAKQAESSSFKRSAILCFLDYICGLTPLTTSTSPSHDKVLNEEEQQDSFVRLSSTLFSAWLSQKHHTPMRKLKPHQKMFEEVLGCVASLKKQKETTMTKKKAIASIKSERSALEAEVKVAKESKMSADDESGRREFTTKM